MQLVALFRLAFAPAPCILALNLAAYKRLAGPLYKRYAVTPHLECFASQGNPKLEITNPKRTLRPETTSCTASCRLVAVSHPGILALGLVLRTSPKSETFRASIFVLRACLKALKVRGSDRL